MIRKLLFTLSLSLTLFGYSQDTTSYRMISCEYENISFFNTDSTDMTSISPSFGTAHVIFSNPVDSLIYMIADLPSGSGDRNLYSLNPFDGTYSLVADFNVEYINSGDLGNDNTLYVITGNGNGTPGEVTAINMTTFVETSLFTSAVSTSFDPTAMEFNSSDSSLYIYESYNNNLFVYDLSTSTESALVNNFADDEHHGGYYDAENDVFHLGSYGGDLYISDDTYLNGGNYASANSTVMDLTVIEHTVRADSNYFAFCPGTDSVMISLIYSTNSVSWMKDGVVIPGETNDTIYVSSTGVYQAIMEIGNADGYMISEGIELDLFTIPNVQLSSSTDSLICPNETITINGSNPGNGIVQWYLNGTSINGETSQNLIASTIGIYNQLKTNQSGCSDSASVAFQIYNDTLCDLGLTSFESNVAVFPNPAVDLIEVSSLDMITSIEIVDLSGKIIITKNGYNDFKVQMNIENLNNGIYIVNIYSGNSVSLVKLIK